MTALDWAVLLCTLALILGYGTWKTSGARKIQSTDAYLRGGGDMKWYTIGLSVMATQASAITFLSTPGQAYEDGLGFVQFYLGLPVAMVLLATTIVPLYYRLRVYTAYEYLETRFDQKTRQLTAFLFLIQRGLGAGLSIYAPAIILSTVLGWPLHLTNLGIGAVVIAYTVSGGTRAVSYTQTYQMAVMLGGMALGFAFILHQLPPDVSFGDTLAISGALGKMQIIDFSPRLDTRYTFWSGLTGGLFVQLAYFGTDQSQVQRYLGGSSLTESRLGLLMNGLVKVPMQLFILLVGMMVFVFYQFQAPPVFFNQAELAHVERAAQAQGQAAELAELKTRHAAIFAEKKQHLDDFLAARHQAAHATRPHARHALQDSHRRLGGLQKQVKQFIARVLPGAETKDADYIFITFVTEHFPAGLVGLLLAVILCASMSATASALNALGSTTVVDLYRRSIRPQQSDRHYLQVAKLFTVFWGICAVCFAAFASLIDNLIQAVNILGSLFYGPTLGVFLVGFFLKHIRGTAVFWALVASQALVIAIARWSSIGYLWYNVIGCTAVCILALMLEPLVPRQRPG